MYLVVVWVDPGDIVLLEVGWWSNLLGFVKGAEIVRLDLAVKHLDYSVSFAVVMNRRSRDRVSAEQVQTNKGEKKNSRVHSWPDFQDVWCPG